MTKLVQVTETRCSSCKHFKAHTCPRNDLYLHPTTLVQPNFAVECNIYKKVEYEPLTPSEAEKCRNRVLYQNAPTTNKARALWGDGILGGVRMSRLYALRCTKNGSCVYAKNKVCVADFPCKYQKARAGRGAV